MIIGRRLSTKRLPAHAWIGEDLIGYLWGNDHRRLTAGHASHQTYENDSDASCAARPIHVSRIIPIG